MKTLFCALLLCTTACLAQNAADFTTNVRVVESKIRLSSDDVNDNVNVQRIIVLIDGHKYELQARVQYGDFVLSLGNYKAKLQEKTKNGYDLIRTYKLLLPDGKTRDFYLSGVLQ